MNFDLKYLPERTSGKRSSGITMVMDKGMGAKEAGHFVESSAPFTDLVKLGFGTALITPNLKEKISIYKSAGLKPYFGGTLFEMFFVRDQYDDFKRFLHDCDLEMVEVSDGSIRMDHHEKLECVEDLARNFQVLSEVGSKVRGVDLPNEVWVSNMKTELDTGAWKVIAEARESGTIGIYQSDGSANRALIDDIIKEISVDQVVWEAPNKSQQTMFIKLIGANVNLGNIAPGEVVALEALRCGMRGDTFFDFLPVEFHNRKL